jgi:hypothetical protein
MAYDFLNRPMLQIGLDGNDIEFYAWMESGGVIYSVEGLRRFTWEPAEVEA